jgi:transposase-like protein
MSYQEVLSLARNLSKEEQLQLIVNLTYSQDSETGVFRSRGKALINKQDSCPHCGGKHYIRFGTARGAQRFRCKDCGKTFNEYSGTWLEGIHKKSLAEPYMSLMIEHNSLDKIRKELNINKKTAFDWRHKILSSYEQNTGDDFEGIVESDETFFGHSEKGSRHLNRPPRKRGGEQKNVEYRPTKRR